MSHAPDGKKYDLHVFKWGDGKYPHDWNIGDRRMNVTICTLLEKDLSYMFAAAPEMLEALTKAEDMINRSVSGMAKYNVLDWTGLLVQMQSTIRKARGEE